MTFTTNQKLEIANSMIEFFPTTFKSAFINMFGQITIRMTDYEDLLSCICILEDWDFVCTESRQNNHWICKQNYIGYKFSF